MKIRQLWNFAKPALAFLALLAVVYCIAPHPAKAATPLREEKGLGAAILELNTDVPRTMTPTAFALTFSKQGFHPSAIEKISCELIMPAMPMPPNHPKVELDQDRFRGEMVFTMAGQWKALFLVSLKNGRKETLSFDIEKVLLK